ncbi:MAG: discoidin domain-containing protein [Planctomycetes bacterium]|nr:discoidin domain-containing protein [Planctomycetota bacterium]
MLAVQASLVSGELRISFTPSSTIPEQVARLTSDGTNYTVRNTNNVSVGTFSAVTTTAISAAGSTGNDRLELPATGSQPIADPLTVASTIETVVIAKAVTPSSGGLDIGSQMITLAADVVTPGSQTYAGNVTLQAAAATRTTGAGSRVRFEGVVSGGEGTSLVIDSAGPSVLLGGLGGTARLVKRGAGRLEVTNVGTFASGAAVEGGEVVVRQASGLGSAPLAIGDIGQMRLDVGTSRPRVAGLSLAEGGRLDVGAGGVQVAAGGFDLAAVRQWLARGRGDGGWNGQSGIMSTTAAATSNRSVGYAVNVDGSLSIAFAAAGDTNLDGVIDVLDASNLIASGSFDSGANAGWSDGDANADGVVDVLDIADLLGTSLFDQGGYLPTTVSTKGLVETWEQAATSRLPASGWVLQTGTLGTVAQQDARGAGRKYAIAANQSSRLMRPVSLSGLDHVVVQGWFSDSTGSNRGMLGLASFPTVADAALVRMGATAKSTYRIEYVDPAQPGVITEVDTGLAAEAGWHFMRLDLVRDPANPVSWQATFRGWNTARTSEVKKMFSWAFDPAQVRWATLGSAVASTAATAWDDVRVGSLAEVGPPPALPMPRVNVVASASSSIPGWEPAKFVDADDNTVYSSNGHGPNSTMTEWAAIDLGAIHGVGSLAIAPRSGGWCFPVDYEIQSSADMTTWTTVPGQVHVGQERPEGVVTHTFSMPVQARGLRVYATRLSPDGSGNHYLQIARLEVPRFKLDTQPWVSPVELRGKSLNSTGIFSNTQFGSDVAPTPRFLAQHPDYLANHPFDGVTVPLIIDPNYLKSQGIVSSADVAFQWIGMSSLPIPWSAVSQSVAYLKQVNWGKVTDNFMWYGVQNITNDSWEDGDTPHWVDPASATDWSVVVANAAVAARAAREGGLKGFIIDTEQYTRYPGGARPEYPFGLGTAATWRERGRQWIEAVQAEYPDIELQFFFSWGDEYVVWSNYHNLVPFMDGVLAGIRDPARIVHAWESSFWWGQARAIPPGSNSFTFYDADRDPYIGARDSIRNVWRTYAHDPAKYDDFVDVGMAAWFESDPWNLWPGWPSGYLGEIVHAGRSSWPSMPWSNVSNTLAYSDKYVWTWSANTHYSATYENLNPFLASVANQTFNTGTEAVAAFTEEFTTDPMKRGWYFDFSFMDIGRRPAPDEGPPQLVQTTDAVAYAWNAGAGGVDVRANWSRGEFGQIEGLMAAQRRRYVKPVEPLTRGDDIRLEMDLSISSFGSDVANPILAGLFHSAATSSSQSLAVEIADASTARVVVAGDGTPWSLALPLAAPLEAGRAYRTVLTYTAATRQLSVELRSVPGNAVVSQATGTVPMTAGPFVLDEAGIAQREAAFATPAARAHRFRLDRFSLARG